MARVAGIACLTLFSLAVLGGCNRQIEMEPGEWEVKIRVTKASGAGLPAAALNELKSKRDTSTRCLEDEDVDRPERAFFKEEARCSTGDVDWADGRIGGRLVCNPPDGTRLDADLDGEYAAEDFEIEVDGEMTLPQLPGQTLKVTSLYEGRRVGECRGSRSRDRDRDRR